MLIKSSKPHPNISESRKHLPIWSQQSAIRNALDEHNILFLSGSTGSGKSTQLPQFLLNEPWCQSGRIAVTQPRQVAAVTLAIRVAEEMHSPLGRNSPNSKVGYSIRFDNNVSASTRITYLTEGMLLQEMLRDPVLSKYSCIVVDEVHERSINTDLILGFLKQISERGDRKVPLKVVVMSATVDLDSLVRFFGGETADSDPKAASNGLSDDKSQAKVAICNVKGRQHPVTTVYLNEPTGDIIGSALERIFKIHRGEALPGDILVFMAGQDYILNLQRQVEKQARGLPKGLPKMLVLPLYAALPQWAQQKAFEKAPPNTRKVILSTNIAETSVTVPGVRYVIDSGKAKIKQYREGLGLDSLLVKPISKSSADQRKGRAGREAPGQCFRLYTEAGYNGLDANEKPEILRCDLSGPLLSMKARGVEHAEDFPFPTPPVWETLEKGLIHLLRLGALRRRDGTITKEGRQMARFPVAPGLARVIIEAARLECSESVIDIVACLSTGENIFRYDDGEDYEEDEERSAAREARQRLTRRQGDHLTLLAVVQAYLAEDSDRRRWADEHLVSHRAMKSVVRVRKQLKEQCQRANLFREEPGLSEDELTTRILKSFLAGFTVNVARLGPDGNYRSFANNQVVHIHPSSVLFEHNVGAIMYNACVFTTRPYVHCVSAIELQWLLPLLRQTAEP
ncbi:P-loop containing nucleoside triphosphate hydrolase protein [Piedraia hortae CBS 480.64]|uniref:RNA helicase n=1 Tax=Piedraia hortae CBS 480.64 TaxID=1314780 RepID=A0A6A7CAU6_9PEZI|nr:P-loop containing nucleoside triphosphate hydrolase protein [Piedraia hortae CBS 480.64]